MGRLVSRRQAGAFVEWRGGRRAACDRRRRKAGCSWKKTDTVARESAFPRIEASANGLAGKLFSRPEAAEEQGQMISAHGHARQQIRPPSTNHRSG